MSAEPIIAFFLLLDLRKILRRAALLDDWDLKIKIAMSSIGVLFILDIIFPVEIVTMWVWHLFLFALIGTVWFNKTFATARTLMLAVLPFAILSFAADVVKVIMAKQFKIVDDYFDVAIIFSVIWMIAMTIVSRKQQKALEKERQKTQLEEEQKLWMAHRKEELESIVAERTAELLQQKEALEKAFDELKITQAQLVHQEKLASLGELTAGIAHEIQNPLNFVNNFSEVNTELIEELKQEITAGNHADAIALANDIANNEQKINHHGKRADAIVKGMLQHSRSSNGQKEPADINELADEYLRLAYHGLRAKDKSFNATMKTDFDASIGSINIIPQDIGRVILNLITNAFYAASLPTESRSGNSQYKHEPTVWVSTKKDGDRILISVKDNGPGIPQKNVDKIFQPFFTTKPTGQGTGLGLSLSNDIVKAHGGKIVVKSIESEGAEFIIHLPI